MLRTHAAGSPDSTACIIFKQPQFASFTFHADGDGAGQGPFPGGENVCEKKKEDRALIGEQEGLQ